MGPDPRIADYIRENRGRYTREAIRQQLIDAGHDPAAIDATWAVLDAPDADDVAGEGFWRRFALIVIGVNLAVFLLVGLLTGMLMNLGAAAFLLGILGVALGIGALIAWSLVAAVGPARMSPMTATVIGVVIPAIFALLIGGACYALIGTVGLPPPPPVRGSMQVELGEPLNIGRSVEAQCQPTSERSPGWSVFANFPGPGGRPVHVSVNSFPPGQGAPTTPMVFVALESASDAEPVQDTWSNEMEIGTDLSVDAADDGLSGSVTFDALPYLSMDGPEGEPPAGDPLSGEISWTCERD